MSAWGIVVPNFDKSLFLWHIWPLFVFGGNFLERLFWVQKSHFLSLWSGWVGPHVWAVCPKKNIFRASLTCQHWWDVQDWRESCARVLRGPAHIAHWLPIENYDNGWALTNSSLMSNIRSNNSVRLQKIWSIQSLKKLIIFQEQLFSTGCFFL